MNWNSEKMEKLTLTFLDKEELALCQRGYRYEYPIEPELDNIKKHLFDEPNPLDSYSVNLKITTGGKHCDDRLLYEENFKLE